MLQRNGDFADPGDHRRVGRANCVSLGTSGRDTNPGVAQQQQVFHNCTGAPTKGQVGYCGLGKLLIILRPTSGISLRM